MASRNDVSALIDEARLSGWTISRDSSNHVVYISPEGKKVRGSGTPSDWRTVLNDRAQLRRHGLPRRRLTRKELQKMARQQRTVAQRMADVLQAQAPQSMSVEDLAELVGTTKATIQATVRRAQDEFPAIKRTVPGRVAWTQVVQAKAPAPRPADRQPLAPVPNGPAEKPVEVEVAHLRPIQVKPTSVEVPDLFEAVTTHKTGAVVLRDPNGELWIAHPIRIELPNVGLNGAG